MPSPNSPITLPQLSTHNTLDSLWIAVHGHVYDLTTFSADHPGGIEALETCAGTDGTETYEYVGHSADNMETMQRFRVGSLAAPSGVVEALVSPSQKGASVERKSVGKAASRVRQLGLVLAKAVGAVFVALLVLVLVYQQSSRLGKISSSMRGGLQLSSVDVLDRSTGWAFWAGMAVASSASGLGLGWLYKLFLSTLDYQNEVFSFPATILRKSRV